MSALCSTEILRLDGIVHGFTTRPGGFDFGQRDPQGAADEQGQRLLKALSFEGAIFRPRQVHGADVVVLGGAARAESLRQRDADGLVTSQPSQLIGVVTADCVPVLLADGQRRVVAAVHAGWRGIVGGVLQRAIELMVNELDCQADRLRAGVGPHIGPCCYEVGADVLRHFATYRTKLAVPSRKTGSDSAASSDESGRSQAWMLDLGAAVRETLLDSGLVSANIECVDHCTHCREDLFYSYRRDATASRQLAVIGLQS